MQFFKCRDSDKAIVNVGVALDEATALMQPVNEGQTLYVTHDNMVDDPYGTPDFTNLRAYLHTKIDNEAGAFRARFITDVPGQAQTYEKKEREARAWTSGDDVTNPDNYPFMIAEATVRGVSVATVQGEIMTQVNLLTPLAALIEAHRMAAKNAVTSATTLPDIMNGGTVDWPSLLS